MKTLVLILIAALAWNVSISHAQVYTLLHQFPSYSRDGSGPSSDLTLDGNTLYGTTVSGGTNFGGTVFKINTDGTGYGLLQCFSNSAVPEGGMVLIGSTLYGTTFTGGAAANGSIFKVNTDGSGYSELHGFSATFPTVFGTNSDGNRPQATLVTDGFMLYGTAQYGGAYGNGTIFKIDTNGMEFSVIKTFSATFIGTNQIYGNPLTSGTNMDGARPVGALVLDGSTLYGTAFHGGNSNGVVFAMQTDGGDFTVLKYFSPIIGPGGQGTNSDGAGPIAGLTLNGETLYGDAVGGGALGIGTVFKLRTNGTDFVNLHDFLGPDGGFPRNALLLDGATLYGTTGAGGTSNRGTIFMVLTNGADFTVLKNFDALGGSQCISKFVLSSNALFCTAFNGGTNGGGVLYRLTVLPSILNDPNLGIQSNSFGFDYTGISNQTGIIEFSESLSPPAWIPLETNLLIGGPLHFSDPQFNQNPSAFYRIRSP